MNFIVSSIIVILLVVGLMLSKAVDAESMPENWAVVFSTAATISGDSQKVLDAIELAKKDKDILNENSSFYVKANEEFGRRYLEWVSEDLEMHDVPSAVFKTVLYGYGYMGYLDWKNIYNATEALHELDKSLKVLRLAEVLKEEKDEFIKESEKLKDLNKRANLIVKKLEEIAIKAGKKLIWFDESGDSYAFFVIDKSAESKLKDIKLDSDHQFKSRPVF